MKKVININLGGMVFSIEEDAFKKLEKYLSEIKLHFESDDSGDEIILDIESSIAEKFSAKNKSIKHAVTSIDVKKIISELGTVEDLDAEENAEKNKNSKEKKSNKNSENNSGESFRKEKINHRLYRDSDDMVLGGVCSGMANYFNIDPVLSRILFIIFTFLTDGFGIFIYIVLWIIIPKAKTASQKISMKGEIPSLESIKNFMSEKTSDIPESTKNIFQKILHFPFLILKMFVNFIKNILPIFRILLGSVLFFISALSIFVLTMFFLIEIAYTGGDLSLSMDVLTSEFFQKIVNENNLLNLSLSFYISLVIPFIFMIFLSFYLMLNRKSIGILGSLIMFLMWIFAISYAFVFSVKNTSTILNFIDQIEQEGEKNPDYEIYLNVKDEEGEENEIFREKIFDNFIELNIEDKEDSVKLIIDLENPDFSKEFPQEKIPFGDDPNLIGGDAVATPVILGQKEFSIIGDENLFSPATIMVQKNDKVTLRFKSNVDPLKLLIFAFNTQTDFSENEGTVETIFVANEIGEFPIYSKDKNGKLEEMGKIIVK